MKLHIVIHVQNAAQAMTQAHTAFRSGASSIFLISHLGADDTLPELTVAIKTQLPELRVGLNCLSSDPQRAFALSTEAGADMLWFDDAGFHSIAPDETKKAAFMQALKHYRNGSGNAGLVVFVGVGFKYQRHDPQPEIAAEQVFAAGCVPTGSGAGTGIAASPEKIAKLASLLPSAGRLALASGVSADNLQLWSPHVTDVFVASSVSVDDYTLSPEKVRELAVRCQ